MKIKSKLMFVGVLSLCSVVMLSGCSNKDKKDAKTETSTEQVESKSSEKVAEKDAQTVLNYVYNNKTNGLDKVSNQSAEEFDNVLKSKLEKKQEDSLIDNGNKNDYYLSVDGSEYYADEIIEDYATAYLKATRTIGDAKVEKVTIDGDEATVTAKFTPIARLSEASPIGQARTQLFGGLDEEEFIRQSQNKDVKTIKSLITLKLYAMYYGDMSKEPEKLSETKEVTFTMTKKGDHFMISNDEVYQLMKESRDGDYADSKVTTESSSESSDL